MRSSASAAQNIKKSKIIRYINIEEPGEFFSWLFFLSQGCRKVIFRLMANGSLGEGRGRHMNCIAVHIDASAPFLNIKRGRIRVGKHLDDSGN